MKIEIKDTPASSRDFQYPCILESTTTGLIIFAPSEGENSIVLKEDSYNKVGEYFGEFDPRCFKLFTGSITLSN